MRISEFGDSDFGNSEFGFRIPAIRNSDFGLRTLMDVITQLAEMKSIQMKSHSLLEVLLRLALELRPTE